MAGDVVISVGYGLIYLSVDTATNRWRRIVSYSIPMSHGIKLGVSAKEDVVATEGPSKTNKKTSPAVILRKVIRLISLLLS